MSDIHLMVLCLIASASALCIVAIVNRYLQLRAELQVLDKHDKR